MECPVYLDDDIQREPRPLPLVWVVIILTAGGFVLYHFGGLPHLPRRIPSWMEILVTLQGSELPLDWFAYAFTTAAWILWTWCVTSLLLQVATALIELVTHGATWARGLRATIDRVTLPIARRVVDGAIVTVIVVNLVARAPAVSAAPLEEPVAALSVAPDHRPDLSGQHPTRPAQKSSSETSYTVKSGDTLWGISQRFYGTGEEYMRLVDANAGRRMPDGEYFTRAGVIRPGWVLIVPRASTAIQSVNGRSYYVVEKGDTLRGIAARFLGDENRWPEIFDLNRGKARLPDGRVLTDPDLIWPSLRLTLPEEIHKQPPPAQPAPAPQLIQPPRVAHPTPAEPTVTVVPTEIPASPTPVSTPSPVATTMPIRPSPTIVSMPSVNSTSQWPSPLINGAAGLAVAGAATLFIRRRLRRSLREPPVPLPSSPKPNDEFATAGFAGALRRQLQDGQVDPVTLLTWQVLDLLAENGVAAPPVVMAKQERNAVTLALAASLAAQDRIVELAEEIGHQLGGIGRAEITPDHDVAFRISSLALARLGLPPTSLPRTPLCFLPLGVLPGQQTLWGNWPDMRHVLIAGLPGGGADVIFASLLAALSAHRRPDQLQLWTLTRRTTLPDQLRKLPHQQRILVDPDEEQVQALLEDVRAELLRRMHGQDRSCDVSGVPEIVLLVDEIGMLPRDDTTLEMIGTHGPSYGMRVIATTTNAATLGELLAPFSTRLVLQTLDEEESVLLLGRPDAADLGSAEVLVRIEAREPVCVRGFQVSAEHLSELLVLMDAAYGPRQTRIQPETVGSDPSSFARLEADDQDDNHDASTETLPATTSDADDDDQDGGDTIEHAYPSDDTSTDLDPTETDGNNTTESVTWDAPETMMKVSVQKNGHTTDADFHLGIVATRDRQTAVEMPESHIDGVPATESAISSDDKATQLTFEGPVAREQPRPVIEVRCFGEFTVRSGDRELTPSLDERTSLKAWEILAFLASQRRAIASRERLLAAVWPDLDDDRAANCMRVEMRRLRLILARHAPGLSSQVVRCDRTGICSLDQTLVWTDVRRFSALCRSATRLPPDEAISALTEAVALYRGDLLTGRGAYFYAWAEEREADGATMRDQYRGEYVRATQRLAQLYCRAGQPAFAVPLYKNLLKAEPTLEDVVRELFRCYQQLDDLGALIREERHLREALREANVDPDTPEETPDACPPERETSELFEAIRSELEARNAVGAVRRAAEAG